MPNPTEGRIRPLIVSARNVAAVIAGVAAIGGLDYLTGPELSFSIFYLIPISLAAWRYGRSAGVTVAAVSALVWLVADLSSHVYSYAGIPYWNALVRFGFFVIIASILSARKVAERRILELMNMKSRFTSTVSHELRTPLACIKEGIDIVVDGTAGDLNAKQQEYLHTAKRNVDRLSRLLNNVLQLQKFEAGRVERHIEECDLNAIAAQALDEFKLAARNRPLEFEQHFDASIGIVACDSDQIRQVLGNLISNAVKFTDHGVIRVTTTRAGNNVRVDVEDQGIGIAEGDIPKLFRTFTQVSAAVPRRSDGTGLGLAIARHIIEAHRGTIGVRSSPGRGSTFYFTLPLDPSRQPTRPMQRRSMSASVEPPISNRDL